MLAGLVVLILVGYGFSLGVFVGIFAYCLVVLRTVRAADDELASLAERLPSSSSADLARSP